MPHSRSSAKSYRKSEKRRIANRDKTARMRTEVKKARAFLQDG